MALRMNVDFTAQEKRIAEMKAAIRREQEALKTASLQKADPPHPNNDSHASSSSSRASSASSSTGDPSPSSSPLMWTRVQERMRVLHAWEAKCVVEEEAVQQLEREVQRDMEASMGRKAALMERLQRLCHEEALLKSTESLLEDNVVAMSVEREKREASVEQRHQQQQSSIQQNLQRRQQLQDAQRDFKRRKALRQAERQSLKEEIADLDTRTAATETKIAATVQRISDQERQVHLSEVNLREREQSRIEALQHEVCRLASQLEVHDS
jgi:hypothetical protein